MAEHSNIEKREYTRVAVQNAQLHLQFANDLLFARQYIENISVGGLFVKTNKKFRMAELIPIEISIPSGESPKKFSLSGRVARIAADGVGLEFTGMRDDVRRELENFVRSILPQGVSIHRKVKASSVDHLEQVRLKKLESKNKLRRLEWRALVLTLLVLLNLGAINYFQSAKVEQSLSEITTHTVNINGQEVERAKIRGLNLTSEGRLKFLLADGSSIDLPKSDETIKMLPSNLQFDLKTLESLKRPKVIRSPKNSHYQQYVR